MGRLLQLCTLCLIALGPSLALADFVDVTQSALGQPPDSIPGWTAVHWPDYDGDGWPDLHLGADILYRNNGDGSFTRVMDIGLETEHTDAYRASWADADNDGDLDCVQSSAEATSAGTIQHAYYFENEGAPGFGFQRSSIYDCPLHTRAGQPLFVDGDNDGYYEIYQVTFGDWAPDYGRASDRYFEADGGGVWTDVTSLHFPDLQSVYYERHGRAVVACDWDSDYDSDIGIFVAVSGVDWIDPSWENLLWGDGDDGFFDDLAPDWGVAVEPHGIYGVGLAGGASWGDYDNDGLFDLVVANQFGWTALYHNNGAGGNFGNVTQAAGLHAGSDQPWDNTAWVDLDNDGDLDLIVSAYSDVSARIYENEGPQNLGQFHVATEDFGFDPLGNFQGIEGGLGAADYDLDGDLDLFYTGGVGAEAGKHLFRNDLDPDDQANHWLGIRLQGDGVNCALSAAGAQVRLVLPSGWSGVKQAENSSADASQHMQALHFGLGAVDQVDWVEVRWPQDPVAQSEFWTWAEIGAAVDHYVTLVQGTGNPITAAPPLAGPGALAIDGIYPNPARDRATCVLESRGRGRTRLVLYDISGRRVRTMESPMASPGRRSLTLPVDDLPNGVYLLRASQGDAVASTKLFILR